MGPLVVQHFFFFKYNVAAVDPHSGRIARSGMSDCVTALWWGGYVQFCGSFLAHKMHCQLGRSACGQLIKSKPGQLRFFFHQILIRRASLSLVCLFEADTTNALGDHV